MNRLGSESNELQLLEIFNISFSFNTTDTKSTTNHRSTTLNLSTPFTSLPLPHRHCPTPPSLPHNSPANPDRQLPRARAPFLLPLHFLRWTRSSHAHARTHPRQARARRSGPAYRPPRRRPARARQSIASEACLVIQALTPLPPFRFFSQTSSRPNPSGAGALRLLSASSTRSGGWMGSWRR